MQTGTYNGTGYDGSSYPNSITVSFPPKIMGVVPENYGFDFGWEGFSGGWEAVAIDNVSLWSTTFTSKYGFGLFPASLYGRRSGNTVYWYSSSGGVDGDINQFNESGTRYKWFALG